MVETVVYDAEGTRIQLAVAHFAPDENTACCCNRRVIDIAVYIDISQRLDCCIILNVLVHNDIAREYDIACLAVHTALNHIGG
ncbi:hypothetical protein D3C85_1679740 [compost metagenome]